MDEKRIEQYNIKHMIKRAIHEMQGIAAAITCDGQINDTEIQLIKDWLNKNFLALPAWPLSELATLLRDVLKDGIITPDERIKLSDFLKNISAETDKTALHIEGVFTNNPSLVFTDKTFCFTGKFKSGSRGQMEKTVAERNGIVSKGVVSGLDYLVVGSLGQEAWKYSGFGEKIQKAMDHNAKYTAKIEIIREEDFIKAIESKPATTDGNIEKDGA